MSSEIRKDEELRELLRDVIASNLTVACQMEMLRREMHSRGDQEHPFAKVLELFEMVRDVMDPVTDEDDDALDEPDDEALDMAERTSSGSPPVAQNPFASTMRYLRPRRKE